PPSLKPSSPAGYWQLPVMPPVPPYPQSTRWPRAWLARSPIEKCVFGSSVILPPLSLRDAPRYHAMQAGNQTALGYAAMHRLHTSARPDTLWDLSLSSLAHGRSGYYHDAGRHAAAPDRLERP